MKLLRPFLGGLLLALAVGLAPARSEAAIVRLHAGADYQLDTTPLFLLALGVETPLAGPLSIGGRFGALIATRPNDLGAPIDLVLRLRFGRTPIYVEGTAGPWIFFGGDTFRGHGAFGFGFQGRSISLGLEVGWLDPKALIGARLGWRF
jgi:hypothetical protein